MISKAQEISKLKYKLAQLKAKLEEVKSKAGTIVRKEEKLEKQKSIKLSTVIFSSIVDSATHNSGLGMLQKRIFMMNRDASNGLREDPTMKKSSFSPVKDRYGSETKLNKQVESKPTVLIHSPSNLEHQKSSKAFSNPFKTGSNSNEDSQVN